MKRGAVYLVSQGVPPTREREERVVLRPVVLVSRDAINQYSSVVLACPLVEAASMHKLYPSDVLVRAPEGGLIVDSVALTGQLRALSRAQCVRHLGELSNEAMEQINRALRITLDLE